MDEWSRETPWRQGHVLPDEASKALGLSHSESPERTFIVVISHDCDLAQAVGKEPFVELIIGRVIEAIKSDSHAKSPRRLQIEFQGSEGPIAAEILATDKKFVKKNDLAPFDPKTDVALDAQGLSILQRWLAVRYRRSAFPDEFERRLKDSKLPRRIEKALDTAGKYVVAVFFNVDDGDDYQHNGSDDPYRFGIYLLYDTTQDEVSAETAAQNAAEEIEKAFESAFQNKDNVWENIQLEYCDVIADGVMTYKDSLLFKQWRLEHISLEGNPLEAIFTAE